MRKTKEELDKFVARVKTLWKPLWEPIKTERRVNLNHRFAYHPPKSPEIIRRHEAVRAGLKECAFLMAAICPQGREFALGMIKLEEAMMWFNGAVARNHAEIESE